MSYSAIVLIAVGGAFLFEGAVWAIFPEGSRRLYQRMMSQMGERDLHVSGLISVFIGAALIAAALVLLPR